MTRKDKQFHMRLSDTDNRLLERLSEFMQISKTQVLKNLLYKEARKRKLLRTADE